MQDERADQIIQRLTKIEELLQSIAEAMNRMSPPEKEIVYLPRLEPESPPPPGAPPIIKSSRVV